jgi:hypothetical protein
MTPVAGMVFSIGAFAQQETPEEELHVHRLKTETTAPYDAWAYANRIATQPEKGQSPVDFAGIVLLSRLTNLESRIEVKVMDGFDRSAYLGYKSFMRSWPEPGEAVGNCVVCHTPPNFTSDKKFVVDESGVAKAVPSLRNLKMSDSELRAIVEKKVAMGKKAQEGKVNVDEAYKLISLDEQQVNDIVTFLKGLREVPKDDFRDLITNATILDTSDLLDETSRILDGPKTD